MGYTIKSERQIRELEKMRERWTTPKPKRKTPHQRRKNRMYIRAHRRAYSRTYKRAQAMLIDLRIGDSFHWPMKDLALLLRMAERLEIKLETREHNRCILITRVSKFESKAA